MSTPKPIKKLGKATKAITDFIYGKHNPITMTKKQLKNQSNIRPLQGREHPYVISRNDKTYKGPVVDLRGTKGPLAKFVYKNQVKNNTKGGKNFPKILDSKMMDQVNRRLDKIKQGPGARESKLMVVSQAHDKNVKKNYRKVSALEKFVSVGTAKNVTNSLNKAFKKRAQWQKTGAPHLKTTTNQAKVIKTLQGQIDAMKKTYRKR